MIPSEFRTNWAGNYTFNVDHLYFPQSMEELQQVVMRAQKLKAVGTRHSFSAIADTAGDQISMRHFDGITIDRDRSRVTVAAGVAYGRLAPYLNERGYALHNLASLPHISVVGACATATHGSGVLHANLASAVCEVEFIAGTGELVQLSREKNPDEFNGIVVALGALGVVASVTLELLPAFQIAQLVYENLSFDVLRDHLEEVFASGYSVSLFTDWRQHRAAQVWRKLRAPAQFEPEFFGATPASENRTPLPGHAAQNCTQQMGVPGAWCDRLPHFRMEFTPSSGQELQTEYFVLREQGFEAISAIEELRDRIAPHLYVTELRSIAADEFWMSPCYRCPSLGIHFTWKPESAAVEELLPLIESKLGPFGARPHWAKRFAMDAGARYPRLSDFKNLARKYDPEGKFRNAFLEKNVYGC